MIEGLAFAAGVAVGAWGYRYWLKRDPERLEAWAKRLKSFAERAELDRMDR